MSYLLDFRSRDPEVAGLWGPFDMRSQASDFAYVLRAESPDPCTWTTIPLRDPNTETFSGTR
ncbi:hypothetical protein SEA_MAGRITTE_227 [Microbacterium phage Magritte]|nr:hypothetical protein SEA_MAGRITTE_227 [Microbacterium phage Magritte]